MDFYEIKHRIERDGTVVVYFDFKTYKFKDLMIKGKAFYAVWDEDNNIWSRDEFRAYEIMDNDAEYYARQFNVEKIHIQKMRSFRSKSLIEFRKFISSIPDTIEELDSKVTFNSENVKRSDLRSKRLPYDILPGECAAYDELMSTLYDPEERDKIEWAVGSVLAGDSIDIQKFIVLYGEAGTGKSTVLDIITKLFKGYTTTFDAKELASRSNQFATDAFKDNPLIAIQHDGDLSKIEDNTKVNSIVSHEMITINGKYVRPYASRIKCFLFMGTNQPVKITDAKSGIIRRLIDVRPSGRKIPHGHFTELIKRIDFELGEIANHCLNTYERLGQYYYDTYRPLEMMFKTDVFYNYVESCYDKFVMYDGVSLKSAWTLYKEYCQDAMIEKPLPMYKFREELKNYFKEFKDQTTIDGKHVNKYYSGFITSRFNSSLSKKPKPSLIFDSSNSQFDTLCKDYPAQLANKEGNPRVKWVNCKTTLKDIDTSKLHYVKVPENHIVIDFDLKNPDGSKSLEKNLEAASKWPPTYAELSKSGAGIHLHYIYEGDPTKLSHIYSDDIEIKVFTGNSSLRRMLTRCNDIPIATINSGLPLREEKPMINVESVKSEKALRKLIERNLNKEIHGYTRPSIDFIHKILEDAYNSDLHYDVSDMKQRVLNFATKSSHQAKYCVEKVGDMKFKSDEPAIGDEYAETSELLFYDVEVFKNLFVVVYKAIGKKPIKMINPSPVDIEQLIKFKLIGFNCRRYDNHILYARLLGYTNEQLYNISQRIIVENDKTAFFGEAYGLSYTDIYDFCSTKQSLKKWEIELGIHHQELGLKWDQEVPEDLWEKVADYCINDVVATEAVWNANQADFAAREILADLAGMTVNDTTNSLTTRIIFGNDKHPQSKFMYRNLAEPVTELPNDVMDFLKNEVGLLMPFDEKSLLPYFPGYKFEFGHSLYKGKDPGEGGYVYSEPGIEGNVGLFDVASMHPSSLIDECLLGPEYTRRFKSLLDIRIAIKHKEYDKVAQMFDGKLEKYLGDKESSNALSKALKIAINSVYGLTSAKFDNPFRDPRNEDNIVAKRGALFMMDLEEKVKKEGYKVLHIKTDSIKVPDTNKYVEHLINRMGKQYGYNFEYEANYNKICLVNKAVYIAKYSKDGDINGDKADKWTATGAQFQHPYVFKKLFSHEPVEFKDMCETKNVSTALYLDMNESLPDVSQFEVEYAKLGKQLKDPKSKLNSIEDQAELDRQAKVITDRMQELEEVIKTGHNYIFVGRTGLFCPMKDGCGAGILVRENKDKFDSAPNSSGTRWMESEMVKALGKEKDINVKWFDELCDRAIEDISKFGDFYWLVSNEDYVSPPALTGEILQIDSDELPF